MVSFPAVYTKIVDLIFRRVIFLFLVGVVLSFLFIDQSALKMKTLNTMLPSASDLKEFIYHPSQMNQEKIKDMLTYYKFVCDFMGSDTYEKPAACGIVGYAYYYLGNDKKAIDYLSQSNKLYDHFFWTYYNLEVIYFNEGNYEQSMNYFVLAKEAYPYTVGFFSATRSYVHIAECLKLNQDDFSRGVDQGAERIKKLYIFSSLLIDHPALKEQFVLKKFDLRLF